MREAGMDPDRSYSLDDVGRTSCKLRCHMTSVASGMWVSCKTLTCTLEFMLFSREESTSMVDLFATASDADLAEEISEVGL